MKSDNVLVGLVLTALLGASTAACTPRLINGPRAVRAAAARVHSAHIAAEGSGDVLANLTEEEARRLASVAASCAATADRDSYAATPRPWPAVLVLLDARGGEAVLQLVGLVLRFDGDSPYLPSLEGFGEGPPIPVWECTLGEEDEVWLWDLMTHHLGPTQEKSYLMLEPLEPLS